MKKNKIKLLLRGYYKINNPKFIYKIKNEILDHKLNFNNEVCLVNLIKDYNIDYNLLVKSVIFKKLLNKNFNKNILTYFAKNKKSTICLPKDYSYILKSNNLTLSKISKIRWLIFLFLQILKSFFIFFNLTSLILLKIKIINKKKEVNNFFLDGLTIKNFYKVKNLQKEKNIFSSIHSIENKKINFFQADLNHYSENSNFSIRKGYFFGHCTNLKCLFRFIKWFLVNSLKLFTEFLKGKWIFILSFDELMKAEIIKQQPMENLYNKFFFSNSSGFMRPFYTFLLEKKNVEVIYYFYSLNSDSIHNQDRKNIFFRFNTWKKFYIWNDYNLKFIERFKNHKVIYYKKTQPIFYEGSKFDVNYKFNHPFIVIFDISPSRLTNFILSDAQLHFYNHNYCIRYLKDIKFILSQKKINVFIKKKRKFIFNNPLIYDSNFNYNNYIQENFSVIDAEVNAADIIYNKNCIGVISMIFTSTAHIAKLINKNAIYYTPFKISDLNLSALGDVNLVCGKKNLERWIDQLINRKS